MARFSSRKTDYVDRPKRLSFRLSKIGNRTGIGHLECSFKWSNGDGGAPQVSASAHGVWHCDSQDVINRRIRKLELVDGLQRGA